MEVEDVHFDRINKTRFLTLMTAYTAVDAGLYHPLSVASITAELHVTNMSVINSRNNRNLGAFQKILKSFQANLSIREAMQRLTPQHTSGLFGARVLYTGLPVTACGLFFFDLCQMLPYNYFRTKLDISPGMAGFSCMILSAPLINPPSVLMRLQVKERLAQADQGRYANTRSHSLVNLFDNKLPKMEGGTLRVIFRGTLASLGLGIPSAVVGWHVYEGAKELLTSALGYQNSFTSFLCGVASGVVSVVASRPLGVVLTRFQVSTERKSILQTAQGILKKEGVGAFYKGLGARVLSTAPRMGVFYSVYQTFITWAKKSDEDFEKERLKAQLMEEARRDRARIKEQLGE